MEEYLGIALRVSIMYIYALVLLRLAGKRSIADLTVMDFVVVNILGNLIGHLYWTTTPLSEGLTAMATIVFVHTLVAYLEHRSDTVHFLAASDKTVVVKNGRFEHAGLKRERTSKEEVYAELRLKGEDRLEEVREASWEPDGHLSVLKKEPYKEVQKRDKKKLQELFK